MLDRAENLLHDHYGGKDYWDVSAVGERDPEHPVRGWPMPSQHTAPAWGISVGSGSAPPHPPAHCAGACPGLSLVALGPEMVHLLLLSWGKPARPEAPGARNGGGHRTSCPPHPCRGGACIAWCGVRSENAGKCQTRVLRQDPHGAGRGHVVQRPAGTQPGLCDLSGKLHPAWAGVTRSAISCAVPTDPA